MSRKNKLSKYLIPSILLHILLALMMSRIYAQQPQNIRKLEIISSVRVQYEEPEPPPKPKVVAKTEPQKTTPKKKEIPKKREKPKTAPQKIEPPKVTQQARQTKAPAGMALGTPDRNMSTSGAPSLKGTYGAPGDRPGMSASGGINHPNLTTKAGGTGLSPGITHGSMKVPAGSGRLPGAGGKEAAGFRLGSSPTGTGAGQVDIAGRGGSGGSYGRDNEGPGAGSSTTGRLNVRGGQGTTGLGVGAADGVGGSGSEPGGSGTGGEGSGAGTGGEGGGPGPGGAGSGGYQMAESRGAPNLPDTGQKARSSQELPGRGELPEEKRSGATGKKEFKANLERGTANIAQNVEEPAKRGFEDALQGEINKDLYSLRKLHEDWQNLKLSNIPKTLQITIELGTEKSKPKILKLDFHNPSLPPKIVNDLTKKIKSWKFESLYDGKDDPDKWPIKLTGKISWQ